jgi:CRISPR/Cas system CMR-associated protein Cmr3 (group 5 of RAMP superfamily)
MANQRNLNKHMIGAYVYKQDKQLVAEMAKNHNVNQSDVVKASLHKFSKLNKKEQGSALAKVID